MFEQPTTTIAGAAERLGITRRAAQQIVDRLVSMEMLQEITGGQRNRVYLTKTIFDALDAPSAPMRIGETVMAME